MIKFDIHITVSRLVAFVMLIFGFLLSWFQKDQSAFITACSASGVVIAIKTGLWAYGLSRSPDPTPAPGVVTKTSKTETTSTTAISKDPKAKDPIAKKDIVDVSEKIIEVSEDTIEANKDIIKVSEDIIDKSSE